MATIAVRQTRSAELAGERRFFLVMAVVFVVVVFAGFGLNAAMGRVKPPIPPQVYFHGAAFGAWILLYLVQCTLVDRGSIALHCALGWFGTALAAIVVPLGVVTTVMAMQRDAVPFFFPPNVFIVMNPLAVMIFGALFAAAVVLRRRPEWHRRLMYAAAVNLIAPAFGRLLPMPLLGPWGPHAITATLLVLIAIGIGRDMARRGRVHPAWWWGAGATTVVSVGVATLSFAGPIESLAAALMKK